MGKAFFGYQLEGLKLQGGQAVWIPLGVYPSEEALARAKSERGGRPDLVEFRQCAYFLDDCDADRVIRRPSAGKVVFDDTHLLA
jgi:hypothetical protein